MIMHVARGVATGINQAPMHRFTESPRILNSRTAAAHAARQHHPGRTACKMWRGGLVGVLAVLLHVSNVSDGFVTYTMVRTCFECKSQKPAVLPSARIMCHDIAVAQTKRGRERPTKQGEAVTLPRMLSYILVGNRGGNGRELQRLLKASPPLLPLDLRHVP